jgi:hypothetical protein
MEWDKFWSTNTRFQDAKAGRYMAISTDSAVPLMLVGGEELPNGVEGRSVALHDKNLELGNKVTDTLACSANVLPVVFLT